MPNFLDIKDLDSSKINKIIDDAGDWKKNKTSHFLKDKNVLLIFEKPSLRTRISFEVCVQQLGGNVNILNSNEFKLGERESVFDTAKVLERYLDLIVIRCFDHTVLEEFASYTNVPVVNALTDTSHPCQVIADLLTIKEKFKDLNNKKISWFGDCNNVTHSWIEASALLGLNFYIACPKANELNESKMNWIKENNANVFVSQDVDLVAKDADCILTDTWVSMGDKKNKSVDQFVPFQVNKKIMSMAKSNALFLHCLPAQRGLEVTKDVIEGPNSVVFDQAENRLHAHKSIVNYCFS